MSENTWGIRLNRYPNSTRLSKGQLPDGCPIWLQPHQIGDWQKQGLIIWNDVEQRLAVLSETEALSLLNELVSQEDWKSEGVKITRRVQQFENSLASKDAHRKKGDKSQAIESTETKSEWVQKELVNLPPNAGVELIRVIEENKQFLIEVVEEKKKKWNEALGEVYNILIKFSRTNEEANFEFHARQFPWECLEKTRWSCQHEQAKGQVCLNKSYLFWYARVERLGFAENSKYFPKLEEAVEWVETELVELANQPMPQETKARLYSDEQIEADHIRLRQKLKDGPYWIEPFAMEPERITYQVIFEVDAKPIDYKTIESECGKTFRYDFRYLTPSKMTSALGLDFDHFKIEQPGGENSEWFRITSLTSYYLDTGAIDQAQKVWDQSHILQQYKTGKISRARYGYREVETNFCVFLGGCEDPENPWWPDPPRQEHMALLALRESLCFALDVNDFRDYLGMSAELISDERLLEKMHETRAKSKCIPPDMKTESKLWLVKHKHSWTH